ncbi:MAG: SH3 domain-containing protein [Spirochaetes bacterium]|nr:SH3 domain-containing protein [Spirochaetota bacterium]
MKIIFLLSLIIITIFTQIPFDISFANENQYGIIKGTEVNLRSAPSINSGIVRQLMNKEFVIYYERSKEETKIGKDKDYWYKIKTTDNMQGWVFGKYFYYLDENIIPGKYYHDIIEHYILRTLVNIPKENDNTDNYPTIVFDISFKSLDDKGYIIFNYQSFNKPAHIIMGAATLFYKIENGTPRMVIYTHTINDNNGYFFIDKYIFAISKLSIIIYDITKLGKSFSVIITDKLYREIDNLHLGKWLKKDLVYNDSYIDFDEKTLIATMHLRDEKNKPMRVEKFKFRDGKFEHIK